MCDCCATALQYPDLTKKTYSMGCNWCAARYLNDGGEADVSKWAHYGVDPQEVNGLRASGELIDPALTKRRRKA